jgi:hypothetical protein|tara:strand:+ start:1919 stop:2344 length:426 start_codon:yes stop_codon:yes gene_type:complete
MTARNKKNTLPLTEALVFDIVTYLLDNKGVGFSNEISYYIVDNKPRRYTSREVVGILRNRPMFRHAKTEERQGGIKWRLDLGILEKYLIQKGYMDRFQRLGLENRVSELKGEIINKTILVLGDSTEGTIDEKYNLLAEIWG